MIYEVFLLYIRIEWNNLASKTSLTSKMNERQLRKIVNIYVENTKVNKQEVTKYFFSQVKRFSAF